LPASIVLRKGWTAHDDARLKNLTTGDATTARIAKHSLSKRSTVSVRPRSEYLTGYFPNIRGEVGKVLATTTCGLRSTYSALTVAISLPFGRSPKLANVTSRLHRRAADRSDDSAANTGRDRPKTDLRRRLHSQNSPHAPAPWSRGCSRFPSVIRASRDRQI
jgi:hypothetical protein